MVMTGNGVSGCDSGEDALESATISKETQQARKVSNPHEGENVTRPNKGRGHYARALLE